MKKQISIFATLFFIAIVFFSCSKDDSASDDKNKLPEVTTVAASNIVGNTVVLGGNITSSGSSSIFQKGVCWSKNSGAEINSSISNYYTINSSQIGQFNQTVENNLEPNTVYYFRAFAENSQGIKYGNELTFITGSMIFTTPITNITTTKATLNGRIEQSSIQNSEVGFVWNTSPNPTVNNYSGYTSIYGTDNYHIPLSNLIPKTVYYVRSYVKFPNQNVYYYGEEQQFKTAGYFGPAGGYVAYDKGVTTDGWRYLEIWTQTLSYNISWSTGGAWGNTNYISGTLPDFGSGLNNSTLIAANVPGANCAAKLCLNYVKNGYSDWFLGSSQEMLTIATSLNAIGMVFDYTWTSTELGGQYAASVIWRNNTNTQEIFDSYPKIFDNLNIFPIRRY